MYPHLDYFRVDTAKASTFAHWTRASYKLDFCHKATFGNHSTDIFVVPAIKFLYIQGDLTMDILSVISRWRLKPVVIASNETSKSLATEHGLVALLATEADLTLLTASLLQLVDTITISEEEAESPGILSAIVDMRTNPGSFCFSPADVPLSLGSNMTLWPTQILSAHRQRRGIVHDSTITSHNIPKLSVQYCREFDVLKQADRLKTSFLMKDGNHPAELEPLLQSFVENRSGAVGSLHQAIRKHPRLSKPAAVILGVPCISKSAVRSRLTPPPKDRVLCALESPQQASEQLRDTDEQALLDRLRAYAVAEQELLCATITVLGMDTQTPSICLERLDGRLFRLANNVRTAYFEADRNRLNLPSLRKALAEFDRALKEELGTDVVSYLSEVRGTITVISDLPVEWLTIDKVPLSFRVKVHRYPITPSNALHSYLSQATSNVRITKERAQHLVIVNCLAADDHLNAYPQDLADRLRKSGIPHTFHQVNTFADYCSLLSREKPFFLVHIGHGTVDEATNTSLLQFGKEWASLADLPNNTNIPSIVVFSACDTAPAHIHPNPAAAFLGFGVRAVLATLLPVQADRTTIFIAGLFHDLWFWLRNPPKGQVTWGDLVHGALGLAYLRDLKDDFNDRSKQRRSLITDEMMQAFLKRWRQGSDFVNVQGRSNSYHEARNTLGTVLRLFDSELERDFVSFLRSNLLLPHATFFSHLGDPDSLRITATEAGHPKLMKNTIAPFVKRS